MGWCTRWDRLRGVSVCADRSELRAVRLRVGVTGVDGGGGARDPERSVRAVACTYVERAWGEREQIEASTGCGVCNCIDNCIVHIDCACTHVCSL